MVGFSADPLFSYTFWLCSAEFESSSRELGVEGAPLSNSTVLDLAAQLLDSSIGRLLDSLFS
jgi:hypothetical protein